MGYASQLGSKYNAETAWSSLGTRSFGGYGAYDTARAPYKAQTFQNILSNANSQGYRTRPIVVNQPTSNGLFSFSDNPMSFFQELNQVPNMVNVPSQMFDRLAGSYMNMF